MTRAPADERNVMTRGAAQREGDEMKRSHERMDPDIKALTVAARALRKSTPRMLIPNLEFLVSHFLNTGPVRLRVVRP